MYYHKITEYGIKCCMHAHHVAPRAPPGRGELYRRKTLFLADFPIFFYYPNWTWTHPPTSKLFLDFWNFFNFAKPLRFKYYVTQVVVSAFPEKSIYYIGVQFNAISVMRGWVGEVGVKFPGKKRYVTLEWPLSSKSYYPIGGKVPLSGVNSHFF